MCEKQCPHSGIYLSLLKLTHNLTSCARLFSCWSLNSDFVLNLQWCGGWEILVFQIVDEFWIRRPLFEARFNIARRQYLSRKCEARKQHAPFHLQGNHSGSWLGVVDITLWKQKLCFITRSIYWNTTFVFISTKPREQPKLSPCTQPNKTALRSFAWRRIRLQDLDFTVRE